MMVSMGWNMGRAPAPALEGAEAAPRPGLTGEQRNNTSFPPSLPRPAGHDGASLPRPALPELDRGPGSLQQLALPVWEPGGTRFGSAHFRYGSRSDDLWQCPLPVHACCAAGMGSRVELGFAEEAAPWRLRSAQFPSKVGGRPAWLGESGLPGPAELRCGRCGRPCAFLLQLYAPLPGRPDAFHRGLFVFCCRGPACYRPGAQGPLRVFRNQLPRKNDTYSYDPPPETPPPEGHPPMSLQLQCGAHLCRVCGCLGPKTCSKCHRAHYCSKDHQTVDWKLGHKLSCVQSAQLDTAIPDHKFLFPEYEIVIESEEMETPGDSQTDADTQKDLEKHEELEAAGSASEGFESLDEEVLEAMAKYETREDKIFQKFKNRIAAEPEQILRYCRGGEGPVWISGENIPQMKDIPNCSCGAQRMFEFQVMPQLLNHLKADSLGESIDWGTLVVYTCAENCNQANGYMEEFIWKQDIPANST
ncbi:programmed cell death protein 2 isoform X1 [Caretta caretta]|uniref:programmed cell death protein 2 isoform X1 n=1 Tax=Caretta caretta TaxID=8467 RepID=UPI003F4B2A47